MYYNTVHKINIYYKVNVMYIDKCSNYVVLLCQVCVYIYTVTPDKSNSQGTGKSVRLSEMSNLSEIQKIMQIRHTTRSVR